MSNTFESFFKKYSGIDIWCFQEVFKLLPTGPVHGSVIHVEGFQVNPDLFNALEKYLPSHAGEFCQSFRSTYGIASFLNQTISVIEKGEILVAKGDWDGAESDDDKDHHRKIQWIEMKIQGKMVLIVNAHLTHRPAGKQDSEKRLKQSKIIIDFLAMFDCPKILVGDFNLLPDTESVQMIERSGMRNLVKEYGVTSTRTELYTKPLRFADYVFISPGIKVNTFEVLPDIVADHSPLMLDFDIQ